MTKNKPLQLVKEFLKEHQMISENEIKKLVPSTSKLGFYLYETMSDEFLVINENDLFPLASISKLLTAIMGLLKNPNIERKVILDSISKHCGTSYKKIIETISDIEINQELKKLNIDLHVHENNQDKVRNRGTAKGVFDILFGLLKGTIISDYSKELIIEGLKLQNDLDGFRFTKEYNWIHMTGGLDGVCNDVGYVELGGRKIIVIALLETKDPNVEWHELESTLLEIGKYIMEDYKNRKDWDK